GPSTLALRDALPICERDDIAQRFRSDGFVEVGAYRAPGARRGEYVGRRSENVFSHFCVRLQVLKASPRAAPANGPRPCRRPQSRSEEHTSELQSREK